MDVRLISNESDHKATLTAIDMLWGAAPGTSEGDRLDVLIALVEAYEARRWPPSKVVDPVEIIAEHMRMSDYSSADLALVLVSASCASEILNRKRSLTLPMIQGLKAQWGIPADLLVTPYPLSAA